MTLTAFPDSGQNTVDELAFLYRNMFENAVWGLFQTTIDGGYIRANRALARIYGYETPQDLLTALTNIGEQLYVDPGRRAEFIRQMQVDGVVSGFESQVYRRDRQIIWIAESCREVYATDGRFLYYEGTVEEITARKQVEAELSAAKEQAELANRAKSAFLAHMSHELRTPLNAVMGFAQLMCDGALGPLSRGYVDYAKHIYSSGASLLAIVNDVLDLAEVEAGRSAPAEDIVPVRRLVNAVLAQLADAADAQAISLRQSLPAEGLTLNADPRKLKQALRNLVANAIKFSPAGGVVMVRAYAMADGGIAIAVRDSGIGMTEEEIELALEPFRQVDGVHARRHEGIGLGLSIARAMIELHGGQLRMTSEPGHGTTATAELPASRVLRPEA